MSRQSISARVRFAVLQRDGHHCRYCGGGPEPENPLHIDHVKPVSRGGRNNIENLVTACRRCNLGKAALELRPLIESQRSRAVAALIFEDVALKFEGQVGAHDFAVVHDFCLGELEPEALLPLVEVATSWAHLRSLFYDHAGYPPHFAEIDK